MLDVAKSLIALIRAGYFSGVLPHLPERPVASGILRGMGKRPVSILIGCGIFSSFRFFNDGRLMTI